jgi:cyclomaltodextrinase
MNYPFTGFTLAFAAGDRVCMDLVEIPHYYPYPAHGCRQAMPAKYNIY